MKRLLLAAALLFAATGVKAIEPAFGDNEDLSFAITYRAALVPNIEVATVTLKVRPGHHDGVQAHQIIAKGKVAGFFRSFFDVNDTYNVWMDTRTLRPLKFTSDIREGKYRFSSTYVYNWPSMAVNTSWRNHKNPDSSTKTIKLKTGYMDAISLFYNIRSANVDAMPVKTEQSLWMVSEDTVRRISYRYLGREEKEVKGQGKFKTLKFSINLATSTGESFEDGTELFLWVSDDQNRVPLLIETPIRVGSVKARLASYSNLKYPLDSKIGKK